jgi:glycerol-3-phosphate acyltransferase PlsY
MHWIEQLQSANWREGSCILLAAYFLGCFTTGYYLVRWWKGQDLRSIGSGNVGAKNAGRLLGSPGFVLTSVGDSIKGALAVGLARFFSTDDAFAGLALLAVVAGHIWPAQLRFRGGKGVVTSLGALVIFDVRLACAFALLFVLARAVVRKSVLPGLIAFAALPLAGLFLERPPATIAITSLLAALILATHRKNLLAEIWHFLPRPDLPAKQQPPEL